MEVRHKERRNFNNVRSMARNEKWGKYQKKNMPLYAQINDALVAVASALSD